MSAPSIESISPWVSRSWLPAIISISRGFLLIVLTLYYELRVGYSVDPGFELFEHITVQSITLPHFLQG